MANTVAMIERALRFPPDPSDHAILSFGDGAFQPDMQALISNETPDAGCGLVFFADPRFVTNARVRVQIGTRVPVYARVAWVRELPQGLRQAGLQFLR
jgi:hypothetical protein